MNTQHWLDPQDKKMQLIVISDEALYAECLEAAEADQQLAELKAGKSPATLFGKDAQHVPFRTLRQVKRNERDDDIDFSVSEGKETREHSLSIESPSIRDDVFSALEGRLAGRFQRYEDSYSPLRAAFGPLLTLTVLALGTWGLRAAALAIEAADDIEVSGRKKGLKQLFVWLLETLGPTGVTLIGGALCALTVWYLVVQVRQPPRLHILQIGRFRPASPIMTVLKYGVLATVWLLIAKTALV